MIFMKAKNRASIEGCPTSYYIDGKLAHLAIYDVMSFANVQYCSGVGNKFHGGAIKWPASIKLPTFESLKDDEFKEPYDSSFITDKLFLGWAKNGDATTLYSPLTTILLPAPCNFIAVYNYSMKIPVTINGQDSSLATVSVNLIGNYIEPFTSDWFEQNLLEKLSLTWDSVEYIEVMQKDGPTIVHKDDILQLTTLDELISVNIFEQEKVPVNFTFWGDDLRPPTIVNLVPSKTYTFAELSTIFDRGNVFKIFRDNAAQEEYLNTFTVTKDMLTDTFCVLTDECTYSYKIEVYTHWGDEETIEISSTPAKEWNWEEFYSVIDDRSPELLLFKDGSEIKKSEQSTFQLGYEIDTVPRTTRLRTIQAYEAVTYTFDTNLGDYIEITEIPVPEWSGNTEQFFEKIKTTDWWKNLSRPDKDKITISCAAYADMDYRYHPLEGTFSLGDVEMVFFNFPGLTVSCYYMAEFSDMEPMPIELTMPAGKCEWDTFNTAVQDALMYYGIDGYIAISLELNERYYDQGEVIDFMPIDDGIEGHISMDVDPTLCKVYIRTPHPEIYESLSMIMKSGETYSLNDFVNRAAGMWPDIFGNLGAITKARVDDEDVPLDYTVKLEDPINLEVIGANTKFNIWMSGPGADIELEDVTLPLTVSFEDLDDFSGMHVTDVYCPNEEHTSRDAGVWTISEPDYGWGYYIEGYYEGGSVKTIRSNIDGLTIDFILTEQATETSLGELTTLFRQEAQKQGLPDADALEVKSLWGDGTPEFDDSGWAEVTEWCDWWKAIIKGADPMPVNALILIDADSYDTIDVVHFNSHEVDPNEFKSAIESVVPSTKEIYGSEFEYAWGWIDWPPSETVNIPYYESESDYYCYLYMEEATRNCLIQDNLGRQKDIVTMPKQTTTDALYELVYKYRSGSRYDVDWYKIAGIDRSFDGSEHQAITLPDADPVVITFHEEKW